MPVGGNTSVTMEITMKDMRTFKFRFQLQQHLENSYFAIMMSTQITKHSNLYAYKYLEAVKKLEPRKQPSDVCMNDILFTV